MTVVTRFAPSPTGYLHIGGARTALFNWLYAKHFGGKFYLRIEDTDRARSTQAAIDAILEGMQWLGLDWDEEPVFQFSRSQRHAEIGQQLLNEGKAYWCYCTPEELQQMREAAQKEGKPFLYDRRWRDRKPEDAPEGIKPALRLKAPLEGEITVFDHVQGEVTVSCEQMDDLILLRSDGTPTYLLAVVVDDHDMGITHVIRGDDHFTNTFRQRMIYDALGWSVPQYAHIPLIHGSDGAKLSKRHGALGVETYREMGYLPEAVRNYLLRLGWSHGDDEIISTQQAIDWFGLESVGKSPSRFDFTKLENLNGHYIREAADEHLLDLMDEYLKGVTLGGTERTRLIKGMMGLKARAKTMVELADSARFYVTPRPLTLDEKATAMVEKSRTEVLQPLVAEMEALTDWNQAGLEALARAFAEKTGKKLGDIAQPLRAALTGRMISPGVFEVLEVLGREESLGRIRDVC